MLSSRLTAAAIARRRSGRKRAPGAAKRVTLCDTCSAAAPPLKPAEGIAAMISKPGRVLLGGAALPILVAMSAAAADPATTRLLYAVNQAKADRGAISVYD